jgi:hypothetical protein
MVSPPGNLRQISNFRNFNAFKTSFSAPPVRDLHLAFQVPYIYDYITKLCRQQIEVVQNHETAIVRDSGEDKARSKYKVT